MQKVVSTEQNVLISHIIQLKTHFVVYEKILGNLILQSILFQICLFSFIVSCYNVWSFLSLILVKMLEFIKIWFAVAQLLFCQKWINFFFDKSVKSALTTYLIITLLFFFFSTLLHIFRSRLLFEGGYLLG